MSGSVPNSARASFARGRGGERGRGRSRGRGWVRGRGGGNNNWRERGEQTAGATTTITETTVVENVARNPRARPPRPPKPPLTHFIALPIGHHPRLRESIQTFTSTLLSTTPPIPGLHPSIIIPPRRLHFTLGVMSLSTADPPESAPRPSIQAALDLLQTLKPGIQSILEGQKLKAELKAMDVMKPERGDLERAHVLWLGPANNGNDSKLWKVCQLIQKAFSEAGLLIDERRDLKLHCTIINTIYRKPRTKGPRLPFSYSSLLSTLSTLTPSQTQSQSLRAVDFGTWDVDEIQICEMGSWGEEGEYVSVGGIEVP